MTIEINNPALQVAGQILTQQCHAAAVDIGWWTDPKSGKGIEKNRAELVMLATTQLAKAVEGHRTSAMDTHLPHRQVFETKLAGAVMRIFDIAGEEGFDLGTTIAELIAYNQTRPDHQPAARLAAGGKKY
ncbi:hypothetical protein [Rugamonas sp. DEMB1]|uniref:hypothetical protein n=1 Tax=Rugamonas sp. DEMB1 TaxID=3039386 RepID=UPI002449E80E|nr:hypothetical protein [Rugamonas sp. DEMB1]WGG48951.1 hypothetical protein QC826_20200 [Rugamonas sp. DEMB1]